MLLILYFKEIISYGLVETDILVDSILIKKFDIYWFIISKIYGKDVGKIRKEKFENIQNKLTNGHHISQNISYHNNSKIQVHQYESRLLEGNPIVPLKIENGLNNCLMHVIPSKELQILLRWEVLIELFLNERCSFVQQSQMKNNSCTSVLLDWRLEGANYLIISVNPLKTLTKDTLDFVLV